MQLAAQIVYHLIILHGPGGHVIAINPAEVVTVREPREDEGHLAGGVHCIITTGDGKFSAVVETCAEVRKIARENEQGR
jgi:hypothetical protein